MKRSVATVAPLFVSTCLVGASLLCACSADSTDSGNTGGSRSAGGGSSQAGTSAAGQTGGGATGGTGAFGGAGTAGGATGGAENAGTGSGGASGGTGGTSSSAGAGGTGSVVLTPLGKFALTWYTFQDNSPVNSSISSSGRVLHPFISVAVPFTQLKEFGGKLDYGQKLYIEYLHDRVMPNGMKHTGWVEIDDYCGDNSDDTYCYQSVGGKKYPNTDLYIGDFTKSGMAETAGGDCTGPGGTGQDVSNVSTGNPGALFITNYGGAELGSGKCGDKATARAQQLGPAKGGVSACWGYDAQPPDGCDACVIGVSCASK